MAERFAQERDRLSDLPVPSGVLAYALATMSQPNADLNDLAEVVRGEVSLAAQILRAANSAAMAAKVEIFSVRDALARVGLLRARRLVVALSLRNALARWQAPLPYDAFLAHSLGVANAATLIAQAARVKVSAARDVDETLYLGGLFHDVGLLVLARHYHRDYAAARTTARDKEQSLDRAEREMFGSDHGELGALLVGGWGVPAVAVAAIAGHHCLERAPAEHRLAAQVLSLAEAISLSAGVPDLEEGVGATTDGDAVAALGLSAQDVETLILATQASAHRDRLLLAA